MNKRIKELVRESNLDVYGLGKERYRWEYTVEKFAELLIEECCTAIESTDRYRSDYFIAKLREHFEKENSKTGVGNNLEG